MHGLRRSLILIVTLTLTSLCATLPPAHASDPDDVFWDGRFGRAGTGGRGHKISFLQVHGSDLYAGGDFNSATDLLAGGLARWDGTLWHAVIEEGNGSVNAILFDGVDMYVGGGFTEIDGVAANGIARWDGSSWNALGTGLTGSALALTRFGGDLYVGGLFITAGGIASPNIARWDGSSWHAVGNGIEPVWFFDGVYALESDSNYLYVGGSFETIDTTDMNSLARWDGSSWSPMGDGLTAGGQFPFIYDFVFFDGSLHAGGGFSESGATPIDNIARWDGSAWLDVGGGVIQSTNPTSSVITDLEVDSGILYAAGRFDQAANGTVPAGDVAWWNGSTWTGYTGPDLNAVGNTEIALYAGDLHLAIKSPVIGGVVAASVARWDGVEWHALNNTSALGVDDDVLALSPGPFGDLIVGGAFKTAGDQEFSNIARFDGSNWYQMNGGVTGGVHGLENHQGALIVGGRLSVAGGVPVSAVARWDGGAWHDVGGGMNVSFGPGPIVLTLESFGNLFAGGDFDSAGGIAASNIAEWNGSAWSPLGSGTDDAVDALLGFDGALYAGGRFTTAGGIAVGYVGRWNGLGWSAVGDGFDDFVAALAIHENELHAGGQFAMSGTTVLNGVARWDGSQWQPLDNGLAGGSAPTVYAMQSIGGSLVIAGRFVTAGTSAVLVNGIARWVGSWEALGSGVAPFGDFINTLAYTDNRLYAGGFFTLAGNKPSSHLACWSDVVTSTESPLYRYGEVLAQNTPNPFNPSTRIHYAIRSRGHVSLRVYDVAGHLVATLVDAVQGPVEGGYRVRWNGVDDSGSPVSSGVYFYTLTAPGYTATKKMTLIK